VWSNSAKITLASCECQANIRQKNLFRTVINSETRTYLGKYIPNYPLYNSLAPNSCQKNHCYNRSGNRRKAVKGNVGMEDMKAKEAISDIPFVHLLTIKKAAPYWKQPIKSI